MQIKKTRDYSMFKHITGNRGINKAHVKRLTQAFASRPQKLQWNPILVNEHLEIIDGQHRFEAAVKLESPVYYRVIEGLNLQDCQELNSNSKMWTPNDYARAYCENGNDAYCKYLEFRKEYKLNHDIAMRYLALDTPVTGQSFKDGYLEVPDYKTSQLYAKRLLETGKYVPQVKLRAVALAFLRFVMETEDYDHKRMMKNLASRDKLEAKFTQMEDALWFWDWCYVIKD